MNTPIKILILVTALACTFAYKTFHKNDVSSEVKKQTLLKYETSEAYQFDREFFIKTFNQAHEQAFQKTFQLGTRYQEEYFNSRQYEQDLLSEMSRYAIEAQRKDIAKLIEKIRLN